MQSDDSQKAQGRPLTRSLALFVALSVPNNATRMMETTTYRLKKLPRAPGVIPPTWQMTKLTEAGGDSDTYTVHRDQYGLHCTCGSGNYRHQHTAEKCKHAEGLLAAGLMGDDLA